MFFTQLSGDRPAPNSMGEAVEVMMGGHETILAVEDNTPLLQVLAKLLEGLGYNVLTASEGEPALEIRRERLDIDLLFTDIVLPAGMNGLQIGKAVEKMRPGMKILYTSGYSESVNDTGGRLEPGGELLSKPYRWAELAAEIRRVLDRQSPSRALDKADVGQSFGSTMS